MKFFLWASIIVVVVSLCSGATPSCDPRDVDAAAFTMNMGFIYNLTDDSTFDEQEARGHCRKFFEADEAIKNFVENCFDETIKTVLLAFIAKSESMHSLLCTDFGINQYATFGPCGYKNVPTIYKAYTKYVSSMEEVAKSVSKEHMMHTACCFGEEYERDFTEAMSQTCSEAGGGIALFFTSIADLNLIPDGCHTLDIDCQGIPQVDRSKPHTYMSIFPALVEILKRKYL